MTAKPTEKDVSPERWEADRVAALYDPDTVYRAGVAETPREIPPAPGADLPDQGASPLYARRERRRAVPAMTRDMIRRIADRVEQDAERRRAGLKDD